MKRRKFDPSLLPPAPDLAHESRLWKRGCRLVAGIDEAGRGALAGPVCAAAVVLPIDDAIAAALPGVDDSKKLSPLERAASRKDIIAAAASWGVGQAGAGEIDRIGILPATRLAVRRALLAIEPLPDHLLVDYISLPEVPIPQTSLVKGDARSLSIAAASIMAKTTRDELMTCLSLEHPQYGWDRNAGYGTAAHLQALQDSGPSPYHRMSFAPMRLKPQGA